MVRNILNKRLSQKQTLGFSLIELMVVVAIIGVLSVLAVPQYSRFSNTAKQAEAKTLLSGIYTSELSFFATQATYTSCLSGAGFIPSGYVGTTHPGLYNVGTSAASAVAAIPSFACSAGGTTAVTGSGVNGSGSGTSFFTGTTAGTVTATAPTAAAFTVSANGTLRSADAWTMNQNKTLTALSSGI